MTALLWRTSDIFALLGGWILLLIVGVTVTNTGAFVLDRLLALLEIGVGGLPGYEDFVQLAISCAVLMFFPYCQTQRGHVSVELFLERFPVSVQTMMDRLWLLLTTSIALFLTYWMIFGLLEARSDGTVSAVLGWTVWPFYLPGILSMLLWAFVAFAQLLGKHHHA